MHIDRLEVKGFGKLQDLTVYLGNGLNVIYGSNEAGKTTLQWFIKGMLYGLGSTRRSKNGMMIPLKKFEPWDGGQYGGAMEYTLDEGKTYRVERNFHTGIVRLYDSSFNDITGLFNAGKNKVPVFAEQQLGLDEHTFERTVLIKQMEVRLDTDSTAALAGRIANVNSTGFEEVSFSSAEKALAEARKKYVGTGRTTAQPLDKLTARLKQLNLECDMLQRQKEQRHSTWQELLDVRELQSKMGAAMQFLEHIGELIEIRRSLDVHLKREAGLKDAVRHLNELEAELSDMAACKGLPAAQAAGAGTGTDEGRRKPGIRPLVPVLCLSAAIVFAILLVFLAVVKEHSWTGFAICCTGLLSSALACILLSRPNNGLANGGTVKTRTAADAVGEKTGEVPPALRIPVSAETKTVELNAEIKNICSMASILCGKTLECSQDVRKMLCDSTAMLEELSQKLEQGIDAAAGMKHRPSGCFGANDLDAILYDSSVEWLDDALKGEAVSLKKRILDASLKGKYLEGLLADYQSDSDELQLVEEETVAVKDKISYLKHKDEALKLAYEVLTEAGMEIKRTFAPSLDSSMSSIITGLTAGRYMDLRAGDRLDLKVAVPENGEVKDALMLSGAAADQMYLALRLAMSELLSTGKESLPVILDEAFSQFDDDRTQLALRYLYESYDKRQILIFTCKKREVEIAREIYGSKINLVELKFS